MLCNNNNTKFKKSSFSDEKNYQNCVEVARSKDKVLVRHSKKTKDTLSFSIDEWSAFLQGVKNKEFDLC